MKIEVFQVSELPQLLELPLFKNSKSIPISQARAISHFHNPRADEEDKVLWCLFEENELCAYRLMLPDFLFHESEKIKMAWVSCLWVDPIHRGKGFGKKVTQPALEHWKYRVMGTNFAPASLSLYSSMGGFYPFKIIEGLRLYYKSNAAELLKNRSKLFTILNPLLKIGDQLLNKSRKKAQPHSLEGEGIQAQVFPFFDEESYSFIKQFNKKEFFQRGQKELDWIIAKPWILEKAKPDADDRRFHFSSQAKKFQQLVHKISFKGQLLAVLISSLIDDKMSIPYVYFNKPFTAKVAQYIENLVIEDGAAMITLFNPHLVDYFKNTEVQALHKKNFTKRFMAFKGIPEEWSKASLHLQTGDGDGAFT